jgi:hypothetical protein
MEDVNEPSADEPTASHDLLSNEIEDALEELDPAGDLTLVVGRHRLLVSSRVLDLACPFFSKMLQPNSFLEGIDQPNADTPPTKIVQEDRADTFSLMCRVLHYHPVSPPATIEEYHSLADLSDFYGCGRALSFHMGAWMSVWKLSILSTVQLQTLLWVAYVFHLRDQFRGVSLHLAGTLKPAEWKTWEVHPMPRFLKGTVCFLTMVAH